MTDLEIKFDRPVCDMRFSCAAGIFAPFDTIQKPANEELDAPKPTPVQDELATQICGRLAEIDSKLESILSQLKTTSVEYIEGFVGALLESDRDLIRDKILANLNSALAGFDTGRVSEVFVHPNLVSTIEAALVQQDISKIDVVADPLLQLADCRIEGPEDSLIARLQRQLLIARKKTLGDSDA